VFIIQLKKEKAVNVGGSASEIRAGGVRNLAKQIGEVYTAATKGKSGTKSGKIKSSKIKLVKLLVKNYHTPTKRKQGSKK
jgi:hypothetical protein